MKKFLVIMLFLMFGCNYNSNYKINERKPPIIVIAIDSTTNAVMFRDGDNKVFTFYDTPTTKAITNSLKVGDTLRLKSHKSLIEKF